MHELQKSVAQTVDSLGMHATAPTLLLDLQIKLGQLALESLQITESGRRPFRPGPSWEENLGQLAFAVLALADQTSVDLERAVSAAQAKLGNSAQGSGEGTPIGSTPVHSSTSEEPPPPGNGEWPFSY